MINFHVVQGQSEWFLKQILASANLDQNNKFGSGDRIVKTNPLLPLFNIAQQKSILQALNQRVTVIQGAPGTGKTKLIAGLAYNYEKFGGKILICAQTNQAADKIAETLYEIPCLRNKVLRVKSMEAEDIFNMEPGKLQPYDLLYKINVLEEEIDETLKNFLLDNNLTNDF